MASMAAALVIATGAASSGSSGRTRPVTTKVRTRRLRRANARAIAPTRRRKATPPNRSSNRSCGRGSGGRATASSSASARAIDGLASCCCWLVAFISLLVQIYSLDYVRGDRRYTHFFAALTLFSAGMMIMVLAENMVQLILGWEIMGLCSFMLIGHWWEEEANARAALKAFFTVRVGDVGLLVGTIDHLLRRQPVGAGQPRQQRLQHRGHPGLGAVGRGDEHDRPVWARSPCSSPASASRVSSRCTPGCPTPWPGRRPCRRCCTPRRWSSPACSSSPGCTRCSGKASTSASGGLSLIADHRPRSRSSSPPCWRSCRTTSRRSSPTRPCRSSAT